MNRRNFLRASAEVAVLGLGVSGLQTMAQDAAKKKIPIGVNLYYIRDAAALDFGKVLKSLAAMGYEGIEFSGYYGIAPKEIRKMLDDNGLKCCGTQTNLQAVIGEFDKTVEIHETLGTPFIIVPGGIDEALSTRQGIEFTAYLFNELAEKMSKFGLELGYHAHENDFKKIDNETVWDRFFARTQKNVLMQMDTANCLAVGGDPYAPIAKFPGRSKTIHLKEWGKNRAPIGEGTIDWNRLFELCETVGGTEWYIVEHDDGDAVSTRGIEACIENLRNMGK